MTVDRIGGMVIEEMDVSDAQPGVKVVVTAAETGETVAEKSFAL